MFFCTLCHLRTRPFQDLCERCIKILPWNQHACEHCAEPLPKGCLDSHCQRCLAETSTLKHTLAPLLYAFPVDQVILQAKNTKPELLLPLARLLAQKAKEIPSPQALIPVPMTKSKQRQRGFNQAGIIARHLGRRLNIPVLYNVVSKVRDAEQQQKSASRSMRAQNVVNMFRIHRDQLRKYQFNHIALVDDVITTGSTVQQIALQLQRAGIEQIDAWALARTPNESNAFEVTNL